MLKHGCNIKNLKKYSVVCSAHFHSSVFISYKRTRLLQKNAVPTILISRVKNVSTYLIIIKLNY